MAYMDPVTESDRNRWRDKAESRLRELQKEIHDLEIRLREQAEGGDPEKQRLLEELRIKRDNARLKVNAMRDPKWVDAWNTLQAGVDAAWEDLREAVEKAKNSIANSE